MAATDDLGALIGGRFEQYSNVAGQIYYRDVETNVSTYGIPRGYEDRPDDVWTRHTSRALWTNDRTGRVVFMDPNPPPPQTYLDNNFVQYALIRLERTPNPDESLYWRLLSPILRFLLPEDEGYDIFLETRGQHGYPIIYALKRTRGIDGVFHMHDFMLIESKKAGEAWADIEAEFQLLLMENENESKNAYGMIQLGLEVQFYRYEGCVFSKLGDRMHIVRDVSDIMQQARWLRNHPMAFI